MTAFQTFKTREALVITGLLASTLLSGAVIAGEQTVDTAIDRVKLYRNQGAVVYKSGEVSLPQGTHTLTITGLPADLDANYGLRAALPAGTGRVNGIRTKKVFSAVLTAASQQAIRKKIEVLIREREDEQAILDSVIIELGYLEKIGAGASTADASSLQFVGSNARRLMTDKLRASRAVQEKNNAIHALERQLQETGTERKATITATISIAKTTNDDVPINFTYMSRAANWSLGANADLNTAEKMLDVSLAAHIQQNTGEDWNNVPIALSTSRLNYRLGTGLPASVYQNIADTPRERPRLAFSQAESAPAELKRASQSDVAVSVGNFEAEFSPNQPVNIASDWTMNEIVVLSERTPVDLKVRISPKFDTNAYLYGTATFDIMPDITRPKVTLTRDGQYLGVGDWPDLASGKPLELALGHIEQVKTEKTKLPSEDGESGIFGRSAIDETKVRYTVTSNLNTDYSIEVYDIKPQSMNEDLDITVLRGSTSYTEENVAGKPGLVVWRKTLKPGEKWTINHWLRTKYPSGKTLIRERR